VTVLEGLIIAGPAMAGRPRRELIRTVATPATHHRRVVEASRDGPTSRRRHGGATTARASANLSVRTFWPTPPGSA
jgi:hypothetical protein